MATQAPTVKAAKHKGGRPPAQIDLVTLEELAAIQCTYEEIAAVMRVTKRTLITKLKQKPVLDALEQGRARGRVSVRRAQWRVAQEGNTQAFIWWGKQFMGQRDTRPADTNMAGQITGIEGEPVAVDDARLKLRRLIEQGAERMVQTAATVAANRPTAAPAKEQEVAS